MNYSDIDFEKLIVETKSAVFIHRNIIGFRTSFEDLDMIGFEKMIIELINRTYQIEHGEIISNLSNIINIMCSLDKDIKCEYENARKVTTNKVTAMLQKDLYISMKIPFHYMPICLD